MSRADAREIDWGKVPLGEMSDHEVVRYLQETTGRKVSVTTVRLRRVAKGIAAFEQHERVQQHPVATDPGIGIDTDEEVGARHGITRQRVHQIRVALGIPKRGATS